MRTRLRGAFCVGNQSKIDYTGDYTVSNIVIAFPKPEVAANIRKILSQRWIKCKEIVKKLTYLKDIY